MTVTDVDPGSVTFPGTVTFPRDGDIDVTRG
jgi:hypothetical protein